MGADSSRSLTSPSPRSSDSEATTRRAEPSVATTSETSAECARRVKAATSVPSPCARATCDSDRPGSLETGFVSALVSLVSEVDASDRRPQGRRMARSVVEAVVGWVGPPEGGVVVGSPVGGGPGAGVGVRTVVTTSPKGSASLVEYPNAGPVAYGLPTDAGARVSNAASELCGGGWATSETTSPDVSPPPLSREPIPPSDPSRRNWVVVNTSSPSCADAIAGGLGLRRRAEASRTASASTASPSSTVAPTGAHRAGRHTGPPRGRCGCC